MTGLIALTGGSGFVGQHLLRRLTNAGWRVRALTRRADSLPKIDNLVPVPGTLESNEALRRLVSGVDAVVHCAGLVAARGRNEFHAVNGLGTAALVRLAAAQARPPKFIYISSLAAREPHLSDYAGSKKQGEISLSEIGHALHWHVLRPPVVYGPGDRQTVKLFRQFKHGFALRPRASGRFSMIYVDDLADAVQTLLTADPPQGQIFELDDGHGDGYGWDDMLATAGRQMGHPVRAIPVPRAALHLIAAAGAGIAALGGAAPFLSKGKINELAHPDWVCRNNLLNDQTDWTAKIDLGAGFGRTIDWYVSNGWL